MDINDIRKLIAHDEHQRLELKKTTGELKDAMHTACAFLNSDGGWLVFGIAPTSMKILGQEVTDSTQRELALALSGIEPAVNVHIEYVDVPERPGCKVITMYFEAFVWGQKPYTYHGCPYYKVESTTKTMPREMFEERLRANKPQYYAWERQKADRIGMKDLNEQRIRGAIRLGVERGRMLASSMTEPLETVLDKLQLLTDGVPNNAAAALFGTNIYEYPQFRLRMARFRGTNKLEFIDNQRAEGNFFDLLDAGMSFFFKHLSLSGKIVGWVREEHLDIPAEALREALINALCHRQYEKYNLTIGIAIYDDRIEIENPGVLPPQLTPETIKRPHISYPYNPIMADVLFKTTFLENWGSGAGRIIDACRAQNVPEPEWRMQGGLIVVTFRFPEKGASSGQVETEKGASNTQQVTNKYPTSNPEIPKKYPKNTQQVPKLDKTCPELAPNLPRTCPEVAPKYEPSTEQVKSLILSMTDGYMPVSQLRLSFAVKSRDKFRMNYILPAIEEGAIEREFPDNPKHPKQRYKLTAKALDWKKEHNNESKVKE